MSLESRYLTGYLVILAGYHDSQLPNTLVTGLNGYRMHLFLGKMVTISRSIGYQIPWNQLPSPVTVPGYQLPNQLHPEF